MKRMLPSCSTTKSEDPHEWIPKDFYDFLSEVEHIVVSCPGDDRLLYRGQCDIKWTLISSFARTCKKRLFDIEPHVKLNSKVLESIAYHNVLLSLLLFKLDVLVSPPPLNMFV